MPRMKASGTKTSTAARKTTRAKKTARSKGTFGAAMILLALVCVMGAAMAIAARDSVSPPAAAAVASGPATADAAPAAAPKPRAASTPAPAAVSEEPMASTPGETPTSTAGKTPAPVTIAGCLARSGDAYQLTNTSGADAPKARSWKSGFLKKGSATIGLVEASRAAKLGDHLGERVSVTGVLVDREMQVRSLRRLAPRCD